MYIYKVYIHSKLSILKCIFRSKNTSWIALSKVYILILKIYGLFVIIIVRYIVKIRDGSSSQVQIRQRLMMSVYKRDVEQVVIAVIDGDVFLQKSMEN